MISKFFIQTSGHRWIFVNYIQKDKSNYTFAGISGVPGTSYKTTHATQIIVPQNTHYANTCMMRELRKDAFSHGLLLHIRFTEDEHVPSEA